MCTKPQNKAYENSEQKTDDEDNSHLIFEIAFVAGQKEYEKNLAERFATSEDGEFELSDGESKEWEYLNKSHQSMEIDEQDEPNTDSQPKSYE